MIFPLQCDMPVMRADARWNRYRGTAAIGSKPGTRQSRDRRRERRRRRPYRAVKCCLPVHQRDRSYER